MIDGRSESACDPSGCNPEDLDYLETIALLQDEIARLESELLAQQESVSRSSPEGKAPIPAECDKPVGCHDLDRMAEELAARDETINLLLEQLRLVEEAESASRMEWEQLSNWVADVEERIERQEGSAPGRSDQELVVLRREAEDSRARFAQERQAWKAQRNDFETEVARLQTLLARSAQEKAADGEGESIRILESENQRLVKQCQDLKDSGSLELDALREEVASARRETEEARKACVQLQDERDRERREFEIAIASIRSQASRAALDAHERGAGTDEAGGSMERGGALDADLRLREFRQHLKEIHHHEAEARNRNRLGARLSRLWTRTAPR